MGNRGTKRACPNDNAADESMSKHAGWLKTLTGIIGRTDGTFVTGRLPSDLVQIVVQFIDQRKFVFIACDNQNDWRIIGFHPHDDTHLHVYGPPLLPNRYELDRICDGHVQLDSGLWLRRTARAEPYKVKPPFEFELNTLDLESAPLLRDHMMPHKETNQTWTFCQGEDVADMWEIDHRIYTVTYDEAVHVQVVIKQWQRSNESGITSTGTSPLATRWTSTLVTMPRTLHVNVLHHFRFATCCTVVWDDRYLIVCMSQNHRLQFVVYDARTALWWPSNYCTRQLSAWYRHRVRNVQCVIVSKHTLAVWITGVQMPSSGYLFDLSQFRPVESTVFDQVPNVVYVDAQQIKSPNPDLRIVAVATMDDSLYLIEQYPEPHRDQDKDEDIRFHGKSLDIFELDCSAVEKHWKALPASLLHSFTDSRADVAPRQWGAYCRRAHTVLVANRCE